MKLQLFRFHSLTGSATMFVQAENQRDAREIKNRRIREERSEKVRSGLDRFPCDDEQPEEPIVIDSPEKLYGNAAAVV